MISNFLSKTASSKTGKTAIAGVAVSMVSLTVGFGADIARTFELTNKQLERVDIVEGYFKGLADLAVPALFAGAFIFRGISKKGFVDEDGDGVDDRLTAIEQTQNKIALKLSEPKTHTERVEQLVKQEDDLSWLN